MAVTRLGEAPPGDEAAQRWDNGATLSLGQRLSFDSKKARGGGAGSLYRPRVPDCAEVEFHLGVATNSVRFLAHKGF
jgi:hypothetical protein